MRHKFKFLSFIIFGLSSLISISSCGFNFENNDSSNKNDNQSQNNDNKDKEEIVIHSLSTTDLTNYTVIDLDRFDPSYPVDKKEYVLKNPKDYFTLELSIHNAYKLKIEEVTISGIKYDSNSLICSSDYSNIKIKIQSSEDYGAQIYELNQIKYFNGKKQSVIDFWNKKFVLFVNSKNKVEASNFSYEATSTSLNIKVNISDIDHVTKSLPLKYKLIDKDSETLEIVKKDTLKVGENNFLIDELKEFTNYEFIIFYGENPQLDYMVEVSKYNLQTLKSIELTDIEPDYEKVTFKINNIDNVNITKMYLKNLNKNTEEKHTTSVVTSFTQIFSDTDYAIVIEYKFNEINYSREYKFKTKAYVVPTFKFKSYDVKHQTVSYEVDFDDPLNLGTFHSVDLIGSSIQTLYTLKGTFENCISNMTYKLVLYYYYNLHDGQGNINKKIETTINTLPIDQSDISLNLTLNGKNSLDYALNINNREDVSLNYVELYYFNELKETRTDKKLTGTFTDLKNEKDYTVKAYYEISLPGESSVYKTSISKKIKMKTLTTPTFSLETTPGRKDVEYKLNLKDPDNVFKFDEVRLYKNDKCLDILRDKTGTFSNLLSGNKYILKLVYYLDFNNEVFPRETIKNYEFVTGEFSAPIFNISNVIVGADSFSADISIDDPTKSLVESSVSAVVSDLNINHRISYTIDNFKSIRLGNLHSCTTHALSITYKYDLNDGERLKEGTFNYKFKTLDEIIVTDFSVTKLNYNDPELRSFDIHIAFKNPDHLNIAKIVINDTEIELKSYPNNEININVPDIFNFEPGVKNTLNAFITNTGKRYGVYFKHY